MVDESVKLQEENQRFEGTEVVLFTGNRLTIDRGVHFWVK